MKELVNSLFLYQWKSYKTFLSTGKVKQHSNHDYQEFHFGEDYLTLIHHSGNGLAKERVAKEWSVKLEKSRQILKISFPKDQVAYEVVSINHTDMVLKELVTQDKVFFVKMDAWENLIRP